MGPSNLGLPLNHAAPVCLVPRGLASATTLVARAPQIWPPMNCTCCIRSSPESSVLVEPICFAGGCDEYGSLAMSLLESTGVPPESTAETFVRAQTPIRWSPVPLGSSELKKYSALAGPQ